MISLSSDLGEKFKVKFQDCQDHEDKCIKVLYFQEMVAMIEKLGWHEHTSDWDPWIMVSTEDEKGINVLESPTGYCDFDWVDKDGVELFIDDMSKSDGLTICVDKDKIYGIKFVHPDEETDEEVTGMIIPIDSITEMRFIDG